MALDALALGLQRLVDGGVRWLRLTPGAQPAGRRFVVVQIDGLSRAVLARALTTGKVPRLARLLDRGTLRLRPMSVGIPSSTPFFQAALMYGVRPDIPGFHFWDRRAGEDRYFPRPGVADLVEERHARGRRGVMTGGSAYGCVFTGGATNSLWTLARLLRPTRAGLALLRVPLSGVLLAWVVVKCMTLSAAEVTHALLRLLADPVTAPRGLRWLLIKIGLSIWARQLLTLAASSDLYRGVPAVYVNYLEYDVAAHAFGPWHPVAFRALREVDRSIAQLCRVIRRLPEHRYDLYVLSDHGQVATRPFRRVARGRSIEEVVRATLAASAASVPAAAGASDPGRLRSALAGYRDARGHGLVQRFLNYLERDFPRWVRPGPSSPVPGDPVRVVAAGPNAFVYFTDAPEPLDADAVEARFPGAAAALSRHPGIGLVLARAGGGPVCWYRGAQSALGPGSTGGPFAARPDRGEVLEGLRELMAMASAGDLVLYGIDAAAGHVSFLEERGAHAGPAPEEMQTFIFHPPGVGLPPGPITHPVQLYPHFLAYAERRAR